MRNDTFDETLKLDLVSCDSLKCTSSTHHNVHNGMISDTRLPHVRPRACWQLTEC